jgi:hypothetical protein
MVLGEGDILSAEASSYVVEYDAPSQSGQLVIRASAEPGSARIEASFSWPGRVRGSLLLGDQRHALSSAPEVVQIRLKGENPGELSGFRCHVLPDEPTRKVLPSQQMILALRDGGELARRILEEQEQAAHEVPPANPEELSYRLQKQLLAEYPDATLHASEGMIEFRRPSGEQHRLDLTNAWKRVESGETSVIQQLLQVVAESERSASASRLFPVIKADGTAAAFLEQAKSVARTEAGTAEALVRSVVADGLECLYVFDLPRGMRYCVMSALRENGLDSETVLAHASAQLERSLDTIHRSEVFPGVHMLTCGGNYEASLLMVPRVWAEVDPLLQGERIVAIPNRDLLFVTGSENVAGITWMRAEAAKGRDRAYPISADLFRWTGAEYRPLAPGRKSWLKRLLS